MKIKLPKMLRLALIAAFSLYVTSTTYAQSETWTAASVSGDVNKTFTSTGVITLGDDVTVDMLTLSIGDGVTTSIFGGTTAETELISTGGLVKTGAGTLQLGGQAADAAANTAPVFAMTGVLDIQAGKVQFGQRAANEGEQVDIAFSEIRIAAGAIFEHRSYGTTHDTTALTLNGGSYQNFGTGASRTVTYSALNVNADSNFQFKYGGVYEIATLTGMGNLAVGEYDTAGVAYSFEDVRMSFATMTNYSGTVTIDLTPEYKSRTFELSAVQQDAVTATINGLDVTGTDFVMTGTGGLSIGSAFIVSGDAGIVHEGTLTVGSLSGTSNLTLSATGANKGTLVTTAAGLNSYAADLTIDGGQLTLNGGDAVTAELTIGLAGATLSGDAALNLDNTIVFSTATSTITSNVGLDLSGATLDLSGYSTAGTYTLMTSTGTILGGFTSTGLGSSDYTLDIVDGNKLNLTINTVVALEDIIWAGGDGTWGSASATEWNIDPTGTKTFVDGDFVTFGSTDTTILGGTVTIDGVVNPGSLNFVGAQDYILTGGGSIAGDIDLVMDGTGVVTINTVNSYTGDTLINSGTLVLGVEGAFGTGAVTVADGATLGLGYADAIGDIAAVTFNEGAAIGLIGGITYATEDKITSSLSAGRILSLASGEASVGGVIGTDTRYSRNTNGYTVFVGDGATLTDNVRLELTGGTTRISGTGVYEVNSFLLSAGGATATTLEVDTGATLRVLASTTSIVGGDGSFMVSNWGAVNTINIAGTVEAIAGISTRDGKGNINVSSGGKLILHQGLHGVANGPEANDIVLNISDGATVTLYNQVTTANNSNLMTVNIADGATIEAAAAMTNVYTDIAFAAGGTSTLKLAADRTINFHRDETFDNLILDGAGAVQFTGASSVASIAGAVAGSGNVNVNNASFSLATGTDLNMVSILAGATMDVTQSLSLASLLMADGTEMTLSGDTLTASYEVNRVSTSFAKLDTAQNMTVEALADNAAITYSQASNVRLTNADIAITGEALVFSLSDSTLESSELSAEQINFIGDNRVENSTLSATDSMTFLGDASRVTLANSTADLTKFSGGGGVVLENYTWSASSLTTGLSGRTQVFTLNSGLAASLQTAISESLTLSVTMTEADFTLFENSLATGVGIELGGIDALTNIELANDIDFSILVGGETHTFTFNSYSTLNDNVLLSLASNTWVSTSTLWSDGASWSAAVPDADNVALFLGEGTPTIQLSGEHIALSVTLNSSTQDYTMTGGESDILKTGSLSVVAGTFTLNANAQLLTQIGENPTTGNVSVSTGAAMIIGAEGKLAAATANFADASSLEIADGGELSVQGALLANSASITNKGTLTIGEGSLLGTLSDEGGELIITGNTNIDSLESSALTIAGGAIVTITNASLTGNYANAGTLLVGQLSIDGKSPSSLGTVEAGHLIVNAAGQAFGNLKVDAIETSASISTSSPLISVDSISALTSSSITLGDIAGFDLSTAVGDYTIIGKNSSSGTLLSWDDFTLDAADLSLFNTQKINGYDIVLEDSSASGLVISISLADRRVWSTSNDVASTPGLESSDPSMYFDIIGADGKVTEYSALDQIDIVNVNSNRLVDISALTLDPADAQGLLMKNLQGDAGKTLTILGKSSAESLVTWENSEDSFSLNDIIVNSSTLHVQGNSDATLQGAGLTLNDAVMQIMDSAKVSFKELELNASSVENSGAGSLVVESLSGDAASQISGQITINGAGGSYLGTYHDATVVAQAGAAQQLLAADGLTLAGGAGDLTLTQAGGASIAGISGTGANVHIDYSTVATPAESLTLMNQSSMSSGTLNITLNKSFVENNQMQQIFSGSSMTLGADATLMIAVDLGGGALNFDSYPSTVQLVGLSDGSVIDGKILLDAAMNKYFTNVRFDAATNSVLADFNSEFYTAYALTENGHTGLAMLATALSTVNPQNDPTHYQDLSSVMNALDQMLLSDQVGADRLAAGVAGASHSGLGLAQSESMTRQLNSIHSRVASQFGHQDSLYHDEEQVQGWIRAEGANFYLNGDGTESGYDLSSWGGSVGADYRVEEHTSLGLALTANYGSYTSDDLDRLESDFNTRYISFFAHTRAGNWNHSLILSAGLADVDGERTIAFDGGSYDTTVNTDGYAYGAFYELAYSILSSDGKTVWQPLVNVALQTSTLNGFTETGSDAALYVSEQSLSSATFGLGGRVETFLGENIYNRSASFSMHAMLKAELGDTQSEVDSRLLAADHTGVIRSAERGHFGAELGAGLKIPVTEHQAYIFLDANYEVRVNSSRVSGAVGYSFTF